MKKYAPWIVALLLVVVMGVKDVCDSKRIVASEEATKIAQAEKDKLSKENDALNKEIRDTIASSKRKIYESTIEAEKKLREARKIKTMSSDQVRALKKSNLSWEEKFAKLEESHGKALEREKKKDSVIAGLQKALDKVNEDLVEIEKGNVALQNNFKQLNIKFDEQIERNDVLIKKNKLLKTMGAAALLVAVAVIVGG